MWDQGTEHWISHCAAYASLIGLPIVVEATFAHFMQLKYSCLQILKQQQQHTCIWKRSEQISGYNSSDYGQVSYSEKMQARSTRVLLLAFFFEVFKEGSKHVRLHFKIRKQRRDQNDY